MEFFLYIGYQYSKLIQFVFLYIVPSVKKFQEVKEFYLKKWTLQINVWKVNLLFY